jgi:hypothetical protein
MTARALHRVVNVGVRMSWKTGGPGQIAGRAARVQRRGTGKAEVPSRPQEGPAIRQRGRGCCHRQLRRRRRRPQRISSRCSARQAWYQRRVLGRSAVGWAGTAAPPAEAFCWPIRSALPPGQYAAATQATIARAGFPISPCAFRRQGAAGLIGA